MSNSHVVGSFVHNTVWFVLVVRKKDNDKANNFKKSSIVKTFLIAKICTECFLHVCIIYTYYINLKTNAPLGVPDDILYRASYAPSVPLQRNQSWAWSETVVGGNWSSLNSGSSANWTPHMEYGGGFVGRSFPRFLFSSLRGVVISLSVALLEHHNAYPTNDFKKGTLRLSRACLLPPGIQSYCQKWSGYPCASTSETHGI